MLNHLAGAIDAANLASVGRVVINDISWYLLHFTSNMSNQNLMLSHFASRAATDLSCIKRSSYIKDVSTEINWTFDVGVGDDFNVPI